MAKFTNKNSKTQKVRVPQIGWNKVKLLKTNNLHLKGVKDNEFMYFVHSYYVVPTDAKVVVAKTTYEGIEYVSAVSQNNVFAVQFHPEKSGSEGLKIYHNFSQLI